MEYNSAPKIERDGGSSVDVEVEIITGSLAAADKVDNAVDVPVVATDGSDCGWQAAALNNKTPNNCSGLKVFMGSIPNREDS
jgi:hypothetical protein